MKKSVAGFNENQEENAETRPLNEEGERDASPEAAGAVRGLTRTAGTLAKRSAVGRLPKGAASASSKAAANTGTGAAAARAGATAARRAPVPPTRPVRPTAAGSSVARSAASRTPRAARGGGRVPAKRVAQATDRLSTGLDAVSTAVEEDVVTRKRKNWSELGQKAVGLVGTLAKNTVLGAAVFGVYEVGVEKTATFQAGPEARAGPDVFARVSVLGHFSIGMLAGSAHAVLSGAADSVAYCFKYMSLAPLWSAIGAPYVIHHSVAHSFLFGSYELSKRCLLRFHGHDGESRQYEKGGQHDCEGLFDDEIDELSGETSVDYLHLSIVGTAGGIAGSTQYVVSHYTERWLGITGGWVASPVDADSVKGGTFGGQTRPVATSHADHFKARAGLLNWRSYFLPRPALRPTFLAFIPSAIGFMAFEYGKEMFMDSKGTIP